MTTLQLLGFYWKWKNEWKEMQSDPPVKVYEPDLKEFQKRTREDNEK